MMPPSPPSESAEPSYGDKRLSKVSLRQSLGPDQLAKILDKSLFTSFEMSGFSLEAEPFDLDAKDDPDKFLVNWNSDDDIENPMNWSMSRKWANIALVSIITLQSALASSIVAPGVPQILEEFQITNTLAASFVVSIYVLGFAAGPTLFAPLSELYGRARLYNIGNILFFIFNFTCAISPNISILIVFRFLAGVAGATPLAIGAGTIVDLMPAELRARTIAIYSLGPLLGPAIGPVAGGYLSQFVGWRWTFYSISILSGIIMILGFFLLKETSAKILLAKKAKRLAENFKDDRYRSALADNASPRDAFTRSITRPLRMLAVHPIIFFLSLYVALVYGYLYLFFTTFTTVFHGQYNFSTILVGYSYVGIGVGFVIGTLLSVILSDRLVAKLAASNGGIRKPEFRLPPIAYTTPIIPIGILIYGWASEKKVNFIVPEIGTAIVGVGMMFVLMPLQTYLVDAFTQHAASAIAASIIIRSLFGAFLPLAGRPMYDKLGLGWGNSVLAFAAVAMSPIPWFVMKNGERIRLKYASRLT